MSKPKVCKFYMQGNCHYGSSCRFSHSDYRSHHSNNQYYDDYQPKNSRNGNKQYYDEYADHGNAEYGNGNKQYYGEYRDNGNAKYGNQYRQNNHHSGRRNNNYNAKRDYNNKSNYNQGSEHDYDYQTENEFKVKNYHNEYENNVDENVNFKNNFNRKSHTDKNGFSHYAQSQEHYTQNDQVKSYSNRYKNSVDEFNPNHKFEQGESSKKAKLLKFYGKEIKAYQSRVKELLMSNIWPFTCFHPIGHAYPIQPVGSLNFLEISFEEIRCDYYITKSLCADPGPVHAQSVDSLLAIARKQKEDIILLVESVQDDMLETFEKCEESKTNKMYQNSIETDPNSYWDMCHNNLDMFEANKDLTQSYSFTNDKEEMNTKTTPSVKIFMQTEVYGKANCQAYEDEMFTHYIPIMPPSKKYC